MISGKGSRFIELQGNVSADLNGPFSKQLAQ